MKIIFLSVMAVSILAACDKTEKNEIYNENNTNVINGIVYNINEKPINGVYKTYDEHGNVRMKITSKDGKPHGIGYFYRENGSLQYEAEFTDGVLDGRLNQYYVNGAIHNEMHYTNGVYDGIQKTFDADGNQTAEIIYKQGNPISGYVIFNNEKIDLTEEEIAQIMAETNPQSEVETDNATDDTAENNSANEQTHSEETTKK